MREMFQPTLVEDSAGYALGTRMMDGKTSEEYLYVKAATDLAGETVCVIDENNNASAIATPNTEVGDRAGVVKTPMTSGKYGWVSRNGSGNITVGANCRANVALGTTASPGRLDDSGGTTLDGIVLTAARGAGVGAAPALWEYPRARI